MVVLVISDGHPGMCRHRILAMDVTVRQHLVNAESLHVCAENPLARAGIGFLVDSRQNKIKGHA